MDKDLFLRYVETDRDCDAALLDIAVQKGLRKAKNDRLDIKKLLNLSAACAVTAALCFTVNTKPVKEEMYSYFMNRNCIPQSSAEALDGYIKDIADTITEYLGDG